MAAPSAPPAQFDLRRLSPPLSVPPGQTEQALQDLFASIELEGAPKREFENYWRQDWKRFVYTYGLAADLSGTSLELGANPYFSTTLLHYFTALQPTLANYFGPHFSDQASQNLTARNPTTGELEPRTLDFHHFNIEDAAFPFPDAAFDVVFFCEVLEHMQSDPLAVLREIKRVLKPTGRLILTTPNVARLENVSRLISGANIYDPYSGYGPYGRHNREYNRHEVTQLLGYCGFDVETSFTADVHHNNAADFFRVDAVAPLLEFRSPDLGQYLFFRAQNAGPSRDKRPGWLYRSYPPGEIEE